MDSYPNIAEPITNPDMNPPTTEKIKPIQATPFQMVSRSHVQ